MKYLAPILAAFSIACGGCAHNDRIGCEPAPDVLVDKEFALYSCEYDSAVLEPHGAGQCIYLRGGLNPCAAIAQRVSCASSWEVVKVVCAEPDEEAPAEPAPAPFDKNSL